MIVFILLLILAVLLFGSSAVIGFFGQILSIIVLVIAFAVLSSVTGISLIEIFFWFVGIVAVGSMWAHWYEKKQKDKSNNNLVVTENNNGKNLKNGAFSNPFLPSSQKDNESKASSSDSYADIIEKNVTSRGSYISSDNNDKNSLLNTKWFTSDKNKD
jgi:energy-coupling factor transporter transmembrane protein EcfT